MARVPCWLTTTTYPALLGGAVLHAECLELWATQQMNHDLVLGLRISQLQAVLYEHQPHELQRLQVAGRRQGLLAGGHGLQWVGHDCAL